MSADLQTPAARDWSKSFWRGLACKCPACGEGPVFTGYLRVTPNCAACGEKLDDLSADDAPPYFTIFLVGHIIVPLILIVERAYMPPIWLHMVVWLPLTTLLSLAFLRPIKGAVVGVLWAQREKP